jgi:hypothetical protein
MVRAKACLPDCVKPLLITNRIRGQCYDLLKYFSGKSGRNTLRCWHKISAVICVETETLVFKTIAYFSPKIEQNPQNCETVNMDPQLKNIFWHLFLSNFYQLIYWVTLWGHTYTNEIESYYGFLNTDPK